MMKNMRKIVQRKSGLMGIIVTIISVGLLLYVFYTAFNLFQSYIRLTITDFTEVFESGLYGCDSSYVHGHYGLGGFDFIVERR